ncbi:Zn-ribbon domain-containing OB-fold protein [Rhodococcus globerulus]|uniref:Zn-ribbon domain-containing OB-fold protein n=1 Tax=Rhodococcus globerulus TaxID=33008 RepID=UPI0009335D76|nr:hypothetical protein C8E04_6154 [Rhodococcus globerulus]
MSGYLIPVVDDESRQFWEGVEVGLLRLPSCLSCNRAHYYPRVICPHCGSTELEWLEMSGEGIVYSVTVCHRRGVDGPFEQVIALVDLNEGPRMLCEIRDGERVEIGDRITFSPTGEPALPFFSRSGAVEQ